jgi:hypothetical protein
VSKKHGVLHVDLGAYIWDHSSRVKYHARLVFECNSRVILDAR